MRHHSADNNGDEHAGQDKERSEVSDMGQEPVHKQDGATAHPGADDHADENVPRLGSETRVHESIHGDGLLAQDEGHGGGTEDPGQAVPETGEETTGATILSSSNRSPVVD